MKNNISAKNLKLSISLASTAHAAIPSCNSTRPAVGSSPVSKAFAWPGYNASQADAGFERIAHAWKGYNMTEGTWNTTCTGSTDGMHFYTRESTGMRRFFGFCFSFLRF